MWASEEGLIRVFGGNPWGGPPFLNRKETIGEAIKLLKNKGGSLYMAGPTNFVNSNGTGTTTVGSAVGYVPDAASGVNAAIQATASYKPVLRRKPVLGENLLIGDNSTFTSSTGGWYSNGASGASVGGELVVTQTGVNQSVDIWPTGTKVNTTYQFSVTCRRGSSPAANGLLAGNLVGSASWENYDTTNSIISRTVTTSGTDSGAFAISLGRGGAGTSIYDNVSVREVLGYEDVWYWELDGLDDRVSAPASFTLTSGFCVVVAVTRNALNTGGIIGVSTPAGATSIIQFPNESTAEAYINDGTNASFSSRVSIGLGETAVLSLWVSGTDFIFRKNGVQVSSTNAGHLAFGGILNDFTIPSLWVPGPKLIYSGAAGNSITSLSQLHAIEHGLASTAGVTLA